MPTNLPKTLNHVSVLRDFLLDLIFPIECQGCGAENIWLCRDCFRSLKFNQAQACPVCKTKNDFGQTCLPCQTNFHLNGLWVAGDYNDRLIQKLIKTFKYKFSKDLSKALGIFLSLFLKNLINISRIGLEDNIRIKLTKIKKSPQILLHPQSALLIPVPLHKKRLRWRGFNQSEKLALILAKNLNLKFNNELKRTKYKKAQAKLNKNEREKNIINCFGWSGQKLNNRAIILIDDVTTTGSTLNEAAKILKRAGAGEVWGLVLARG